MALLKKTEHIIQKKAHFSLPRCLLVPVLGRQEKPRSLNTWPWQKSPSRPFSGRKLATLQAPLAWKASANPNGADSISAICTLEDKRCGCCTHQHSPSSGHSSRVDLSRSLKPASLSLSTGETKLRCTCCTGTRFSNWVCLRLSYVALLRCPQSKPLDQVAHRPAKDPERALTSQYSDCLPATLFMTQELSICGPPASSISWIRSSAFTASMATKLRPAHRSRSLGAQKVQGG